MQGILTLQGLPHSGESFFIGLGQGCGHSQLGFFCTSVGISIIFKFLSFRRLWGLSFVSLRAVGHEVSPLMAMITSVLVFVFSFAGYVGSLCSGAFIELPSLKSSSTGESSSSTLESTFRPGPSFTSVTTKATSPRPKSTSSSSMPGACDVWFVWLLCGFPSMSIRYKVLVNLPILLDSDSPSWKWTLLLLPFGAFMRVKGLLLLW